MHLKSAQTLVEDVTAVQISMVQEREDPLVSCHVMGEENITKVADLISIRAEELVLMAESHVNNQLRNSKESVL
jgi:hypothetical protein